MLILRKRVLERNTYQKEKPKYRNPTSDVCHTEFGFHTKINFYNYYNLYYFTIRHCCFLKQHVGLVVWRRETLTATGRRRRRFYTVLALTMSGGGWLRAAKPFGSCSPSSTIDLVVLRVNNKRTEIERFFHVNAASTAYMHIKLIKK